MKQTIDFEGLKRFGEYVRTLRGSRSQEDIADLAFITGSGLSLLENGEREPKLSTLVNLAKALNVHEDKLIAAYKGEDPEKVNSKPSSEEHTALINVAKQLPDRVILESRSTDEIFKLLVATKGVEKMRELMQEALRRNEDE